MLYFGKLAGNDDVFSPMNNVCGDIDTAKVLLDDLIAQGNTALYCADSGRRQGDVPEPVDNSVRMRACKELSAEVLAELGSVGCGEVDQIIYLLHRFPVRKARMLGKTGSGGREQDQLAYAEAPVTAHIP